MKTFQIQYISRYYEEKEYHAVEIQARTEKSALRKFANSFGIKNPENLNKPNYMWEDGEWLSSFKCITEITKVICPTCCGSGKINI